ncbi:exodeoxyribonuclease VII small subunit [Schlesneria paludicola]|uniref:exodeoxyribonuclease VII small subunit n=1 Tax=Schlesneria paludicola TaxID=360056 RepID=UPI00029B46CF|nr:exodeoxyribonuclease VII small subunit [Schlesneria paludicola]
MPKPAANRKSPAEPDNPSEPGQTFEEAMSDLQQIVADLEDNALGLEASLTQFERGIGLLRKCHTFLEQAEQKIEILVSLKENGDVTTAPFDATPTAGTTDPKTLF